MAEIELDSKTSDKLASFLKKGKVRVFECGENRPEYIQDRPFFGLLPQGETTFIQPGLDGENCTISIGEPSEDYILDTENHRFFTQIEERFRNVRPDMTLFVIDPDVVMGRYAADDEPDRSVGKSLYLHIVEKLVNADAYGKAPIDEEYVEPVIDAAIRTSNAFSSTAPVGVTRDNLDGERNISLVVGDNPDTLVDDMFYWTPGVRERMEKEGVTRRQLQQFTLYHEFGHALDPAHKGGFAQQFTQNNVDSQLARHRTECLADAHAVLQLARDYGQTDISLLIGDVRIETTNRVVKKYMEQKPVSDLEAALDKQAENNLKIRSTDPKEIARLKKLERDSARYKEIEEAGASMAYYTTPVVDAAINIAQEKLADGSLMKMKDVEVLNLADEISKKYGLSKEEMTRLRIDMVDQKPNPIVDRIRQRADEALDRMPVSREKLDEMYARREEKMNQRKAAQIEEALGIIPTDEGPQMSEEEMMMMMVRMEAVAEWRSSVYDRISERGADKGALISVLTEEKEAVRKASVKDPIGEEKFRALNEEFIAQAPGVLVRAKANQTVFKQLQTIPCKKAVRSGKDAVVDFVASELSGMDRMISLLNAAEKRDPATMTLDDQLRALHKDRTEFTKVLSAEKMSQQAAQNILSDKEAITQATACPVLGKSILKKSDQKHPDWMTDYQMNFSSLTPGKAAEMGAEVEDRKFTLIADVAQSEEMTRLLCLQKPAMMRKAMTFADDYIKRATAMEMECGKAPKADFKKLASVKLSAGR